MSTCYQVLESIEVRDKFPLAYLFSTTCPSGTWYLVCPFAPDKTLSLNQRRSVKHGDQNPSILPEAAIRVIAKLHSYHIVLHMHFKLYLAGMVDIHIAMTRTSIILFM